MEGIPCYKLKDHPHFPNEIDIPFSSQLRVELLCSICDAITPTGIKDGKDHAFCRRCGDLQTDSDNEFICMICGWQGDRSSMTDNAEEWAILEKMKASCPNQKVKCSFNGSFKDVLIHYKCCSYTGQAPCGLCGALLNRKAHVTHIANECPKRIVQCIFCNDDVEACVKTAHETSCPQRPGTCEHCGQEFKAYFKLEQEHYPKCPRMPVFCPYKHLGCTYKAPRFAMADHLSNGSHVSLLVDAICSQQSEIKELKKENATLKEKVRSLENARQESAKENAILKERMRDIEDCQTREEYLRANIVDDQDDLRQKISELQAAAMQTQPEVDGRISELETKSATFQVPLDRLLEQIARMK